METTTYTTGDNGAEVAYYPEFDEYECMDCRTVVSGPEGHDHWDCDEAARDKAEDAAYDAWRDSRV